MATQPLIKLPIGQQAPETLPLEVFQAVNDLYLAIHNLVTQLNAGFPVMMSPNGHFWKATISNVGVVTWTDIGTVQP
jgi:hypothetical protein